MKNLLILTAVAIGMMFTSCKKDEPTINNTITVEIDYIPPVNTSDKLSIASWFYTNNVTEEIYFCCYNPELEMENVDGVYTYEIDTSFEYSIDLQVLYVGTFNVYENGVLVDSHVGQECHYVK